MQTGRAEVAWKNKLLEAIHSKFCGKGLVLFAIDLPEA
jgi:hypothetical protein